MNTAKEINTEFKARWSELRESLGRNPRFSDEVELSAWLKDQFVALAVAQAAAQALGATEVVAQDGTVTVVEGGCRGCGGVVERSGGRGRPPVRCKACRGVA